MQGSLLILRPVEFCSMNHNALCSASLGVSDQAWKVTQIENHRPMPDSRQLCSHTYSRDNGPGEILGHIISALKAPDWYVTVAVSDSSPLKQGERGRAGRVKD